MMTMFPQVLVFSSTELRYFASLEIVKTFGRSAPAILGTVGIEPGCENEFLINDLFSCFSDDPLLIHVTTDDFVDQQVDSCFWSLYSTPMKSFSALPSV